MMPPMIAPTAEPAPILPTSPLMPSLSSACVTMPCIGYVRPRTVS
jgi:hypothetical protein